MRILFFSSIYPRAHNPNRGIYCRHLCEALAKRHEVRVFSPLSWLETAQPGKADPASGVPVDYPRYYYPPKILRSTYAHLMWLSVRRHMGRVLREFQPDCIVSYWAHPDGAVAVRGARQAGIPAAVMVGGSDVLLLAKDGMRGRCILSVLRQADATIAVSRDIRENLIRAGIPAEKVHIVYRGIDSSLFYPGDRAAARARLKIDAASPMILFIGNLVPVKGLDILLAAARMLRERGVPFRLVIVGAGPLRKSLEASSTAFGLAESVMFKGPLLNHELPDWYRAADLTVLPSRSEGVPNVLRESLACGTPFVASRVGGIPEITQGSANVLVPPENPAALADAIEEALHKRTKGAMVENLSQDWAESAETLVRVLTNLQAGPVTAPAKLPVEAC